MVPYYQDDLVTLYCCDNREVLPELRGVTSVVTDPPYGLAFMGKAWDHGVPGIEFWRAIAGACLPGAPMLAFGGTRTYHRMVCAIEDAGWEVRDRLLYLRGQPVPVGDLAWAFGSGFPKSHNVSKALDKAAPRVGMFDAFAAHFSDRLKASGKTQKEVAALFPSRTGGITGCVWNWANGANVPTAAQWGILQPLLGLSDEWAALIDRIEAEREVVGTQKNAMSGWNMDGSTQFKDRDITAPATPAARTWDGYGTALKPAHEPICLAMNPLDGTFAHNALEHGVAGLNVDGGRVAPTGDVSGWSKTGSKAGDNTCMSGGNYARDAKPDNPQGRWPANIILSYPDDSYILRDEVKPEQLRELAEWMDANA